MNETQIKARTDFSYSLLNPINSQLISLIYIAAAPGQEVIGGDKVLLVLSVVSLTQRTNPVFLFCRKILTFSWGPLISKLEFCVQMHQYTEFEAQIEEQKVIF